MVEVKTSRFAETARGEVERAMREAERRATTAREEAERRAGGAKAELGNVVLDVADEYFPEAARQRRRRHVAMGFVAGVAAGAGAGYFAASMVRR